MKKISLLIFFIAAISCKKKDEKTKPLNEPFDASQATLLKRGNFSSNAHTVSGCVSLYQSGNSKVIYLENFSTDKGPDLKVYLSTSTGNTDIKDLGALKSNSGNFYYSLDSANTNKYAYILVWCREYSVLFGNSQLN